MLRRARCCTGLRAVRAAVARRGTTPPGAGLGRPREARGRIQTVNLDPPGVSAAGSGQGYNWRRALALYLIVDVTTLCAAREARGPAFFAYRHRSR
jgi:hypothetical protein